MSDMITVRVSREEYDWWLAWMADSWPTYPTDRRTDSSVGPWWFARAFATKRRPRFLGAA